MNDTSFIRKNPKHVTEVLKLILMKFIDDYKDNIESYDDALAILNQEIPELVHNDLTEVWLEYAYNAWEEEKRIIVNMASLYR